MSQSKILGAAQANAPSLLISVLIGPAGLAIYDALSRMPRFAKAVLGLLNSTMQPVAVRLESEFDGDNLARLGRLGLLMVAAITAPVLGAAVALSEPILRLWLGSSIASLWPWQAMYFLMPALGALVGFGGSALLARRHVIASMNRIAVTNVAVVLSVGLACAGILQERAFIAGQVLAAAVTFPIQMNLIRREMGIDVATYAAMAKIFAVAFVMAVPTLLVASYITSAPGLIFCIVAWVAICWLASVALALDVRHRRRLLDEIRQRWRIWRGQ
jgi:O-antigen/teichoic acid export membrane protein